MLAFADSTAFGSLLTEKQKRFELGMEQIAKETER
jgi:hypothetical protein